MEENNKWKIIKRTIIIAFKPMIIGIIIIAIVLGILAAAFYFITKKNALEDPDDRKNGPAAARALINNTNIGESGNIELAETIQETWNNLKKQGNEITKYLNSAQELAKLITAASALDYPDTRENPDAPINWDDIDINSTEVQGIVKFKRALANGNTITMKYVSPSKFNELVNNYLSSGSEKARDEALKYFTVEKTYSPNYINYGTEGKVASLNGMVFMGDSILRRFHDYGKIEQTEGAITMFKSGCTAKYFLGKEAGNRINNCIETSDGRFIWEANFKNITNPTGFYLVLGQNFKRAGDRIKQMDELINKIKSSYPNAPIFINSCLYDLDSNSDREAAYNINEAFKNYCNENSNVYYSDVYRGYVENQRALTEDDNDHPNAKGVEVLLKNIKENIVGGSSSSGQAIVQEAEKYVGKLPYVWGGASLTTGADCSGFCWAILSKLGLFKGGRITTVGFETAGTQVSSLSAAQAGDMIVFGSAKGQSYHMGIYDGHGGLIHEPGRGQTATHKNSVGNDILTIRRFVTDTSNTTSSTSTSSSSSSKKKNNNNKSSKTNTVPIPTDDFSVETREIINNHMGDFNAKNFRSFITNYPGGYDGYVKSLGGVFEKYAGIGNRIDISTAGDLQDLAEYVWGLFSIWGFDYYNGKTHWQWGEEEEFPGIHQSAFYYPSFSQRGLPYGNIDDICSDPNNKMMTCCNYGIDTFLLKTTLTDTPFGAGPKKGELITRKEDLQVGDLVHFYYGSRWGHVAMVGEIDSATGEVILYDSGSRFIRSGRYKFPFVDSVYGNYTSWVGRRNFNLDQTTNRSGTVVYRNTVYNVKVATWQDNREIVVSSSTDKKSPNKDPYVEEKDEYSYSMNVRSIPFQSIVSQYKMPFNYLWSMLLISQDKRYVFDLADLVRNSKIEITVHDNLKETTTETKENYIREYIYDGSGTVKGTMIDFPDLSDTTNIKKNSYTTEVSETGFSDTHNYLTTITNIDRTNILDVALTLADSWCVRYEKEYIYNGKSTTHFSPSTIKLDDYEEEVDHTPTKITVNELKEKLIEKGKENIIRDNPGTPDNNSFTLIDEKQILQSCTEIERTEETQVHVTSSSYTPMPEKYSEDNAGSAKSGVLDKNNYTQIDTSKLNRANIQQGFCLAGDFMVYVTEANEISKIFLVDMNTMKQCDVATGIRGHGNTIAYDPKEKQVIFIQDEESRMQIYKINESTKKFERQASRPLPKHNGGSTNRSSMFAYNAQNDKFILGRWVYTRDAFYNRGTPEIEIKYNTPNNTEQQAAGSFGNHVYYTRSIKDHKSGNYLIVCNINTGRQEEEIYDNMNLEIEECDFDTEGNLYIMYGMTKLFLTNYNYFSDTNIDSSSVQNTYNSGGAYSENNKFVKVFNSHYNARSNILAVTDWLYEILEQNSDTANMVDLTKYFLYKATGIDYGVTDFMTAFGKLSQGFDDMNVMGGTSGIDGVQGQIYDFLLAKGVPPVGAAAILGNIQGESGFRPNAVNEIGCSGLCQWYQGRLNKLKSLAASKGTDWTDVNTQMEYLWQELNESYTGVRDVIMSADQENELEYATWYWGRYFEVFFLGDSFEATKGKTAKRYEYAQYWYKQWQEKHTAGAASSVAYAHASPTEKVKGLFPNGAPTTKAQAESYLVTINVPITRKNGTKAMQGVQVHRAIAQDVYNVCVAAQNAGFKIYSIGGYRPFGTDTAGKSGGLSYSQHCYGLAVDINPTENGQFINGKATGNWFYSPGKNEYSMQPDNIVVTTFKSMGWGWGGEWNSSKDYMHFSFMGT